MSTAERFSFNAASVNDPRNAPFTCHLAALSYKSQDEVRAELGRWQLDNMTVAFFDVPLLSCLIVYHNNLIFLAFRGSVGWRDWINNINCWLEPTDHGRVHSGYLRVIKRHGPLLYRAIYPGVSSGKQVVLTGHSRGGALAQLFAFFLALNGHRAHSVWTFGSPMVGNHEFASHWNELDDGPASALFRWSLARPHLARVPLNMCAIRNDPVPSLPPRMITTQCLAELLTSSRVLYISMSSIIVFLKFIPRAIRRALRK